MALDMNSTARRSLHRELLGKDGLVVTPLFENAQSLSAQFDQCLSEQRGIPTDVLQDGAVGGGYSALGNADSFHHHFPRSIRAEALRGLLQLLRRDSPELDKCLNIEIVPDMMLYRPAGFSTTPEVWHRDLSPVQLNAFAKTKIKTESKTKTRDGTRDVIANKGDVIFGGWVNCNATEDQKFICIPRSQLLVDSAAHSGFAVLSEAEKVGCEERSITVTVPPGHLLVFDQTLIHKVAAEKCKFPLKRVFTAFRLSSPDCDKPMIPNIRLLLNEGAVIPLKSGQIPMMFPRMYLLNHLDKLLALSARYPDFMTERRDFSHRAKKRKRSESNAAKEDAEEDDDKYSVECVVLKQIAPSIEPLVPYSEEELALHEPHLLQYRDLDSAAEEAIK